jgi:hypothetical protein
MFLGTVVTCLFLVRKAYPLGSNIVFDISSIFLLLMIDTSLITERLEVS